MNADPAESANLPDTPRPHAGGFLFQEVKWRYWVKRLLVCNPFFLCSAALLLYGVNRLSGDERLFAGETANLVFNFGALQVYEVMLVTTAVVLARRRVWYDASLLVVLEQGLVLVPFMLISQATLQGQVARDGLNLAWALLLSGGMVGVARYAILRRGFPAFHFPNRALVLGGLILAGNVALPLVFRPRMELDVADWSGANAFLWQVVLPLAAAGANLLPRPARHGGLQMERSWLPLFNYGLWVGGSAVHVWCVAHICDMPLAAHQLAPLACVAAWTVWNRLTDCLARPSVRWRRFALSLTFAAPLAAWSESALLTPLAGATLAGYVLLLWFMPCSWPLRSFVRHLALAQLAVLVAGMPEAWSQRLDPEFSRSRWIAMAGVLFVLMQSLRSRRLAWGLLGAAALGGGLGMYLESAPAGLHAALQASLAFLLVHSQRWSGVDLDAGRPVRWLVAVSWVADAWVWTSDLRWSAILFTGMSAVLVLGSWVAWGRVRAERGPIALPAAALSVLCSGPLNWLIRHGSDGVLALVGSLLLFGAGLGLAWNRARWEDPRGL